MFRFHYLAAAALATAAGAASAGPLVFSPTGGGTTYTVNQLDFSAGAVLARNGNQAIANFLNGSGSTSLQVLTQATLAGGLMNSVGVFDASTQPYEITAVLGFGEKVVAASAATTAVPIGSATFAYDTTQPTFVRLYYQAIKNANQLNGTGFNDGTLIFSSTVSTVFGSFNTNAGVPAGPCTTINGIPSATCLDQSPNGNQWNGQQTVAGTGSNSSLSVNVSTPSFIDTNFFKNTPLLSFIINNVSLDTPFTTVDPSYAFTTQSNSLYTVTSNAGVTSTLGAVNGGLNCPTGAGSCVASGPDFEFQTDVNSSISATVPEPGTLALAGLALAAIGIGGSRRRRRA